MHIALQGDVGVGVSQQLAKSLYIAPRLQTSGSKGVAQRVRVYLPDGRLLQIRFDAFPVAAGFGGLGLAAALLAFPRSFFSISDSCFGMGISRREVRVLGVWMTTFV